MFVFTMNNEQSDCRVGNHLAPLSLIRSGYSALTAFSTSSSSTPADITEPKIDTRALDEAFSHILSYFN